MTRTLRISFALLISLVLALGVACSDDDNQVPEDAGGVDKAVKKDGAKKQDQAVKKDGAKKPDQKVKKDSAKKPDAKVTPDMPPTSEYWKTMSVKPGQKLYTVLGSSKSNIYAAGAKGLIMKYNGSAWSTMTNPDTNKTDISDLFINSGYTYAYGSGLILYLSSGKWAKGYTSTSSAYYQFRDVWGPYKSASKIGVGDMGYYMSYKTSNSPTSYWSSMYFGTTKLNDSMYGIWGVNIGEVYVVGDKGIIWRCKGTCAQYAVTSWTKQKSGTTNHLRDIYGFDGKNIFAVGLGGTILKYDGTSWKKMTTNTYTYFYGVWGTSPTDVWAVGHPIFKKDEAVFHYDGKTWKKVPPAGQPYLNAVWGADKDNVWAVGNTGIYKLKKHP